MLLRSELDGTLGCLQDKLLVTGLYKGASHAVKRGIEEIDKLVDRNFYMNSFTTE